jgi:LAO/AO transport system kinase
MGTHAIQDPETLAQRILQGDRMALSRGLSWVEDRTAHGRELLDRLFGHTGEALRIGLTGPPGSGKSTLAAILARRLRGQGHRVGILAVDPTSPFTGGAILGDRIRMTEVVADPGIFIRSMATRGHQGGLSATTYEASELLEAAGYDRILIETVGVGQSELEIASAADTTVVVLVPESGDAIQVMKAGVMEIGDIFVVNKYDRQGGDHLVREIQAILELAPPQRADGWKPPVVATVATRGEGLEELAGSLEAHEAHCRGDAAAWERRRREKLRERVRLLLSGHLLEEAWRADLERRLEDALDAMARRQLSPYAWVRRTVEEISRAGWTGPVSSDESAGTHGGQDA